LTAYIRRLDKIYASIDKSPMLPKVVKKMREEYADNPHDLYLMICHKWGVTPEKEYDPNTLVYGRTKFDKHKLKQDQDAAREVERKEREEKEKPSEDDEAVVKDEAVDAEAEVKADEEVEAEKPADTKYKFDFHLDENRKPADTNFSPNSPRRVYQRKQEPVEHLEYVSVHPGDIVETMVLTSSAKNQETGFWIHARVLSIDEDNEMMNMQVLHPIKYGLSSKAMNVPYRYVRAPANITWSNEM